MAIRLALVAATTLAYGVWLGLIARQNLPLLLLSSHVVFLGVVAYLIWQRLQKMSWWAQTLMGVGVGYIASVFAMGVVTLTLYGADQFVDRFSSASLYAYPVVSFGWLYGALVIAALCWRVGISAQAVPR